MNSFTLEELLLTSIGFVVKETTPYVYALIDKETGKKYIGCRNAKGCHPEELGYSYFSSSKVVRPLFKTNPSRFIKKILYVGDDAVEKEHLFLSMMDAKNKENFYNMHNGCGTFDARKAAEVTVALGIGVHARSKEQMRVDAMIMVEKNKKEKTGIFAPGVADRGRETQKRLGLAAFNPENRRKGAVRSGREAVINRTGIFSPDFDRKENGKKAHLRRFKCNECGMTGASNSIALHQKSKRHIGKTELVKDSVEWINSFQSAKAGK